MEANKNLLLSVPVEVLSSTISSLKARDIARLWNCGSKQLRDALGPRGGVKTFRLKGDYSYAPRWPSLLSSLPHVTKLVFHDDKLEDGCDLLSVSSVLQTLDLRVYGALADFLNALSESPSHFDHLTTLKIADFSTIEDPEQLGLLKTLSSLRSLELEMTDYEGSILDFVPPNLTHLAFRSESIGMMDFRLPKSLESLHCEIVDCGDEGDLDDLPPNLHTFVWQCDFQSLSTNDIVSQLPKSLTHLDATFDVSNERELCAALPPNLRTFRYQGEYRLANEYIKLLPRSLTDTNVIESVEAEFVSFLPSTLLEVKLASTDLNVFDKLPATLTSLEGHPLSDLIPPESGKVVTLPKTLKALKDFPPTLLDHCKLPEGLTELVTSDLTPSRALLLPTGLQTLQIDSFIPESLARLPEGLTSLTGNSSEYYEPNTPLNPLPIITIEIARELPNKLKHLLLREIRLESAAILALLPSSLNLLHLGTDTLEIGDLARLNTPHLKNFQLTLQRGKAGLDDDILTHLPPKLKRFYYAVQNQESKGASVDSLKQLPRRLESLCIPQSEEICNLAIVPSFCNMKLTINCNEVWIPPRWTELYEHDE